MQNTRVFSECSLSITKSLKRKPSSHPTRRLAVSFLKENFSPMRSHKTVQKPNRLLEDPIKAENYLSSIGDPLWKRVCLDVISMMGAASFLKIWDSTLGDVCSQDQSMDIHCQTEETAQFIQQYDFVILGSLQHYLPALKQLKAKINPSL